MPIIFLCETTYSMCHWHLDIFCYCTQIICSGPTSTITLSLNYQVKTGLGLTLFLSHNSLFTNYSFTTLAFCLIWPEHHFTPKDALFPIYNADATKTTWMKFWDDFSSFHMMRISTISLILFVFFYSATNLQIFTSLSSPKYLVRALIFVMLFFAFAADANFSFKLST